MRAFLRFYWGVLRDAPRAVWDALGSFGNLSLLALVALFFFNRKLAEAVSNWHGFSPWWAIVPFGLLVLLGLLRANHQNFISIEKERDKAISQRDEAQYKISIASQSLPTESYADRLGRSVKEMKEREAKEEEREKEIIRRLYREYMLTHNLVTDPQYVAGLGQLPTQWVDKRLKEMGEKWRRKHYTPI